MAALGSQLARLHGFLVEQLGHRVTVHNDARTAALQPFAFGRGQRSQLRVEAVEVLAGLRRVLCSDIVRRHLLVGDICLVFHCTPQRPPSR